MPLGPWELAIILVIIVIIFGVGKLPEIGGALGKGIREFKTSAADPGDDRDDREPKNTLRATTESARTESLHSGPAREEL
jgi:sec-independent protein translocase protein TatA